MTALLMTLLAAVPKEGKAPARLSLDDCLDLARRKNTDLLKQVITYKKKHWDWVSARASFLPTFDLGYELKPDEEQSGSVTVSQSTRLGTSVTLSGSHSHNPGETDPYDTSLSLTVSQPLLRGAGLSDNLCDRRQADLRLATAKLDLEAKAQSTIYDVKSRYYTVARLVETVKVREKSIERARWLREEAAVKLEKGMVTVLDLANAEIQLADRATSLVSAGMQLGRALDSLKIMLSIPLEEEIEIVPITLDLEEVETETEKKQIVVDESAGQVWSERTPVKEGEEGEKERKLLFSPAKRSFQQVLKETLARRPDLRSSKNETRIDELEVARKRNLTRHKLDLAGTLTSSGSGGTWRESSELGEETWSAGLSYSYPWGKLSDRSAYAKALLDLEYQELEIIDLKVEVARSLRNVFRTLEETEKNIVTYARKISAASKALESAKIRKERGKASYWEVTARESDLLDAQTSFIDAYLNYRQTLALLDKESGAPSGWLVRPKKVSLREMKKEKGK